jgi:hypothetical protein
MVVDLAEGFEEVIPDVQSRTCLQGRFRVMCRITRKLSSRYLDATALRSVPQSIYLQGEDDMQKPTTIQTLTGRHNIPGPSSQSVLIDTTHEALACISPTLQKTMRNNSSG